MNKKFKVLMSTSLVLTTVLTACSSGGNSGSSGNPAPGSSSPAPAETPKTAEPVKLRFWGGVPPESGPQTVVDKWNQANKDIQVEYVRFVNDESGNTKLDTALLSTNDAPDLYITYSDANLNRRITAGMAEPLDELAKKANFNIDEIIGLNNIRKTDGKVYYLPATSSYQMILLNKASLDAIGEKVPASWTWDEFAALAKKLTKPGQYGVYFNPAWEPIAYDMAMTQKPTDVYYGDDNLSTFLSLPAFKKGLELQKSLIDAKATYPFSEASMNKLQPQDELLNGKVAMAHSGTYLIRYIKDEQAYPNRNFKVAFAPIPQYEKGSNVNSGGLGDHMLINPKSKNKEAAMKFLAWYLTEGNMDMIPGGRLPSSKKADMDKAAALLIEKADKYIDRESLVQLLQASVTFKQFTKTPAQAEIQKAFKEEAEKYFMNAQPIDATLAALKKRADDAIKAAK
ncbi:multiple sugar transport system substrate-binding protein [Paenibacillus sp. UNCCL117]|uniref:ABC transporter substrate-binding protein n=1 Tax=unclassified Paenibacillus TaxID=185978 RepID=UPI000880C8D0|nr:MULTISPECIES: extracellular solute-binding protein [unclassified Paenibacillus]SDD65937.1 multiple sugar transport system substrate-binding protein [Paenibacillus sp. cl123]SFW58027.1 multiple sugar transport system substrate-binding protein [Paenibacillus sp. UNCCL117]